MPINLIITGVGGQGNVLASQIVGHAAVNKGLRITIGETFGLSQRGGPVSSHIRISRNRDYSPLVSPNKADIILGLEPLETLRIIPEFGNQNTTIIANSRAIYPLNVIAGDVDYPDTSIIKSFLDEFCGKVYWLEATGLAVELGTPILMNTILLGALCGIQDFPLQINDFQYALKDFFPESKLNTNYEALRLGKGLVENYNN